MLKAVSALAGSGSVTSVSVVTANGFSGTVATSTTTPAITIIAPVLTALMAAEIDDGNSGTADTIDFSAGAYHKSTLTGNVTYTFTAPTAPAIIQLKVVQGASAFTITWPTIKWAGGITPVGSTVNGAVDIYTLYYDGTSYWQKGVQFALA